VIIMGLEAPRPMLYQREHLNMVQEKVGESVDSVLAAKETAPGSEAHLSAVRNLTEILAKTPGAIDRLRVLQGSTVK